MSQVGNPGGGGWASRIAGWGAALLRSVPEMVSIFRREGITGGIREIIAGRNEAFSGLSRVGALDALPNSRRPGESMYVQTGMQLTRAMKADFRVEYIAPGSTEASVFTRSMLLNADRTKGAILREFEKRLQSDIQNSAPESDVTNITVLGIDFVGLQIRQDVGYTWEPDDAEW
jgi:hypothetical protein